MNRTLLLIASLIAFASAQIFADEFDSDGVKLHYTVQGSGEPVILIHGLFASGTLNWTAPGITTALASKAQIILIDCRGHGASAKPTGERDYGLRMVEDVSRLMDHLHIKSAHLIGYSMGAMIALKFASLHPARVRSAVLCGAGWMEDGTMFNRSGGGKAQGGGPIAPLLAGFAEFAVPAESVKALRVPIEIIIGENDHLRASAVAPLLRLRPDLTEHVVPGANHLSCVLKPEFKAEVDAALARQLGKSASEPAPKP
jgi:pimeloyl-ACP methyl ester carboxylesterase